MLSLMWKLKKNTEGATILEFAFVLPVLLLLLCGVIEFGFMMLTTSVMEGAAASAARDYKAQAKHWMGAFSGMGPAYANAEIRNRVLAASSGLLRPNNVRVIAKRLDNFGQANVTSGGQNALATSLGLGTGWAQSTGDSAYVGDIVQYEIDYAYFPMTPFIGRIFGNENAAFMLRASMVVQNEPKTFWGSVY